MEECDRRQHIETGHQLGCSGERARHTDTAKKVLGLVKVFWAAPSFTGAHLKKRYKKELCSVRTVPVAIAHGITYRIFGNVREEALQEAIGSGQKYFRKC